ncbi:MAG: 3-hydroxyisobutyrate dehydrogenase [Sphingomonadaceae bacterium]
MKIAFAGLGNMGGGMAANLVKAGHDVRAFDLAQAALEAAAARGCTPCVSAIDAVAGAEAIVTMLPNGAIVEGFYRNTVFGHAAAGALLLDCSTIDVATARSVAEAAAAAGHAMVDAPVSGGIAAAEGGTLTFMVGGSAEAFARAEPILSAMGKAVIHAGDNGAGQAAKICNNMILGATMIATCEAFALAEKLGLDAQRFYDISSVSSGQSWSMTRYCPVPGVGPESPADRGYEGGFATALMLKDLLLARDAAVAAGASTPMGTRAAELYQAFADSGYGGRDFSAIIESLRQGTPYSS